MKKKDPWFRNQLIRGGIYKAIYEAMEAGPEIHIMGEGSHMKIHFDARYIEEKFPHRVITLPISEDGNSNFAVGLSLAGIVPIVDVISSDFLYRTMDAIANTMAKAAAVGEARTMIVRAEFLTGGPTSGQRIESLFAHIPGLHVAIPSNPCDAYFMMARALERKGVTVFFEDRMIDDASMPEKYKALPDRLDCQRSLMDSKRTARIVKDGSKNVTVVSYGLPCRIAEDVLANEDCDIIDLRWISPLDVNTVAESVVRTRKLLVVEPDTLFLGIGAELCAQIAEIVNGVRVKRLGAPHVTIPASRELHDQIMPSAESVYKVFKEMSR